MDIRFGFLGKALVVLRWAGTAVSAVLAVVGLGGLQDDLAVWNQWLSSFDARWIWICAAVILAMFVNMLPYVLNRKDIEPRGSDTEDEIAQCVAAIEEVIESAKHIRNVRLKLESSPLGHCTDYRHASEKWRLASISKLKKYRCDAVKLFPNKPYDGIPPEVDEQVARTVQRLELRLAELSG